MDPLGGGDSAVGHRGGDGQEHQAREHVDRLVLPQRGDGLAACQVADELIEELDRDSGQVGQHDDGGQHGRPAAEPADVGTEGLGGPGERCPAVGRHLVEFAVGVRGEEHRQEAGDDHHRHLRACLGDQDADRGGQGIGRSDRGDAQDSAAEQSDRVVREPFVLEVCFRTVMRVVSLDLHGDLACSGGDVPADRNGGATARASTFTDSTCPTCVVARGPGRQAETKRRAERIRLPETPVRRARLGHNQGIDQDDRIGSR